MPGNNNSWNGNGSDDDLSNEEVLERASRAENGEKFQALWHAEQHILDAYDTTRDAQLALLEFLGFYTRDDREQMRRLFNRSKMADIERGDKENRNDEDADLVETAIRLRRERDADSYGRASASGD